jgi:hypothetical protein
VAAITRGHRKLNPERIALASRLAGMGLPNKSIAAGIGVSYGQFRWWLANAEGDDPTPEETALSEAMRQGAFAGEAALIDRLHRQAESDPKCSTWLLTHSPKWREQWSDSAQARREVARLASMVVVALEQTESISPEQRREVLLRIQAQGASLQLADTPEEG